VPKGHRESQDRWGYVLIFIAIAFVFRFHPNEYFMALWEGVKAISRWTISRSRETWGAFSMV